MHYKSHPSDIDRNNFFAVKVEDLIREIVIQNEIPYYRIESGVERHISDGVDDGLMPVVRIITYFEDTVNKISHVLHDEFDVDIERSVDKKKIRIETFAYKNINYTATLKANRQAQTEYRRAGNKKFEIQICSMLQDAWTGIEKELGYDNTIVPDEAKRDFYRVGALLEMADIEFLKIRTELGQKLFIQNEATQVQPEVINAEKPEPAEDETDATTFVEHLQAIAHEDIKQETPVSQPEVMFEPPVQQHPILFEPQVATISPEAEYTPPPVVHTPVVSIPEVKMEVEQPIVEAPRVAAESHKTTLNIPVPQSIVPKRFAPTAPLGIAPKPTVIPPAEHMHNSIAASVNIDSLKELAQSINNREQKKDIATPAPQPVATPTPAPAPAPVAETPRPAPEKIIPVADRVVNIPQVQAMPPVEPVSNLNVNGNGFIEKVNEVVRENNVEKTIPFYNETSKTTKAVQVDENAQMTDMSLRDYVMNSKLLREIDQMIAERAGAKINTDIDIEGDVERLRFLKVYTLKQLQDRLIDNKNDIVAFAEKWIGKDNGGSFDSGISLFYLEYLLVGKKNDPAFAVEYVVKFISDNDYSARYIIPTYNSIHNTEAPNFSHLTLRA